MIAEPRSIYLLRGPARTEWERRFPNSTGSKRLNISAWQDHPLLAAQKREQYLDPLMWFHSRVKRQVPSKWSAQDFHVIPRFEPG